MKLSADKIYYNFSQENPKSTNIQNPHTPYRDFKPVEIKMVDQNRKRPIYANRAYLDILYIVDIHAPFILYIATYSIAPPIQ